MTDRRFQGGIVSQAKILAKPKYAVVHSLFPNMPDFDRLGKISVLLPYFALSFQMHR